MYCVLILLFDDSIIFFLTQMYLNKIFATKTVSVINQQQLPTKFQYNCQKFKLHTNTDYNIHARNTVHLLCYSTISLK